VKVLAISCHPTTVEILCAGTLAKYRKRGDSVTICHVSNGNKGGEEIPPNELGPIRNREAQVSASIIGAQCIGLDVNDLEVDENCKQLQDDLIDVIRKTAPDVIITHSPHDYSPDLVAVSNLVVNASLKASMFHYSTGEKALDMAVPIYFMETFAGVGFIPEVYVDISDTIETKIEMLWEHKAVLKWLLEKKSTDFEEFVRTVARFRGLQIGVKYAEAFAAHKAWMFLTCRQLLP